MRAGLMRFLVLGPLVAAAILLEAGTTACDFTREIRVGVITSLSGKYGFLGPSARNAASMAEDDVNEGGGLMTGNRCLKVRCVFGDDESASFRPYEVLEELIKKHRVSVVVSAQASECCESTVEAAERAGIPVVIACSTADGMTRERPHAFRVCYTNEFQGRVLGNFAYGGLKARVAGVVSGLGGDYGTEIARAFKKEFESLGGHTVVLQASGTGGPAGRTDLDVLLLPGYPGEVASFISGGAAQPRIAVLGGDAWDFLNDSLFGGTGFYCTHFVESSGSPEARGFVRRYRERYGESPDPVAALTYDAVMVAFRAIETAGEGPVEAVRDALGRLGGYRGVTGEISFGGSGDARRPAVIVRYSRGVRSYVSTFAAE